MNNHITRVPSKTDAITATANSGQDSAVLMLNLDHYTAGADFPDGSKYRTYMAELAARCCSARLYRANRSAANMMKSMSPGRLVSKLRLVLGLRTDPGSAEMYQLQELWVANAVIYRCPGARFPL